MSKITIQKDSVQETLIIPLYGRKICTELFPNVYQDHKSCELVERLDYDFSELEKKINSHTWRFGALETAMRQTDIRIEVEQYVESHPKAAIVNLGCGLDQTAEMCDTGENIIYNFDFEDVIAVRNELLPPNDRTHNIAVNLNDTSWFDYIDDTNGVIFFAAGVFYYFTRREIQNLFNQMADRFKGGALIFDTAGKLAVKLMKGFVKQSGIDDVDALFYIGDLNHDFRSWFTKGNVSAKGYMLGYQDLNDPSILKLYRMLAHICDNNMKMKIVKIEF